MKLLQFFLLTTCLKLCSGQFFEFNFGEILTAYLDSGVESFKSITDQHNNRSTIDQFDSRLCFEQIRYLKSQIEESQLWALTVLDAWSKPPPGIASGNFKGLGNFDQCLAVEHDSGSPMVGTIRGQYCLTPIQPILNDENIIVKSFSTINSTMLRHLPDALMAVCIPDSCSPQVWKDFADELLKKVHFKVGDNIERLCTTTKESPYTEIDIFALYFFALIANLMVLSTIYEIVCIRNLASPSEVFSTFSIYSNGRRIFKLNESTSLDRIECLNGIRVITILWVILGHTYAISTKQPYLNLTHYLTWFKSPAAIFMMHAVFTCDTFLLLSGFLLCWYLMRELDRRDGRVNLFHVIVSRYVRLTPALMASVLFTTTLFKYTGSGPLWTEIITSRESPCLTNWWKTLTYVQNYLDGQSSCPEESWYLAVDFQLFVISTILVWIVWKSGRFTVWIFVVPILISCGSTFWTAYENDFKVTSMSMSKIYEYINKVYYITHTRMAPYFLGTLLGYFMYRNRETKIKLSSASVVCGWISCFLLLGSTYWMFFDTAHHPESDGIIKSAAYQSTIRIVWSILISWIIFACHNGYGGFVNAILSYKLWQPFARISYCIFIVHLGVQSYNVARQHTHFYMDDFFVVHRFLGDTGLSVIAALVLSVGFELPICRLEKLIFSRKRIDSKNQGVLTFTGNLVRKSK